MAATKTKADVAEVAANDQLDEAIRQTSMGEHLKATEFEVLYEDGLNSTISDISTTTLEDKDSGDEVMKTVLHVEGLPRPVVLNKTNTRILLREHGKKPSEDWIGKPIKLTTSMKGNDKLGFDVKVPK